MEQDHLQETASDPYTDLQGCSKKGPSGLSCKSFDDCMMFHLLTMFPYNMAEQEWYNITNVLKKPQWVSVCQFMQHVEQLNSYIAQLTCWYYSPSTKPSTIPMNVPFAKADLASHVIWMCPHLWQDQFNLHEKGMMPIDIHLLLFYFKAIEHVCAQERSNSQSNKNSSYKVQPIIQAWLLRKLSPRSITTSAKAWGHAHHAQNQGLL